MDIAPVSKPTPVVDHTTQQNRIPPGSGPAPVATELAPSDTVQQSSAGFAAGATTGPSAGSGKSPIVQRELSIDPDTQDIVYQAINARGEIVLQLPDQLVLRQRAYANDLEGATDKFARPGVVERFV